MRKLRRDILKGRLAPCFQGLEQGGPASEECPICMTPGYRASYEGCLSAQEVAEREAESREVAEMRRTSTEEVPAQEAPGRLPEGAGHSGRAVPVGSRARALGALQVCTTR